MLQSERRNADRAARAFDGRGEADADEGVRLGRIEDGGDDTDDLAVHRDQRAARIARVDGGVELDELRQLPLAVARAESAVKAGDHAGRHRWADAERKSDRDDVVARLQPE